MPSRRFRQTVRAGRAGSRLRAPLRRGQENGSSSAPPLGNQGRKLYLHEQPVSPSARETVLLELLLHNRKLRSQQGAHPR